MLRALALAPVALAGCAGSRAERRPPTAPAGADPAAASSPAAAANPAPASPPAAELAAIRAHAVPAETDPAFTFRATASRPGDPR